MRILMRGLVLSLICITGLALGQNTTPNKQENDRQAINQVLDRLEQSYLKENTQLLSSLISDSGYTLVIAKPNDTSKAAVFNKQQLLQNVAKVWEKNDFLQHKHTRRKIKSNGPIAISYSVVKDQIKSGQEKDFPVFHILVNEDGYWRLAFSSSLLIDDLSLPVTSETKEQADYFPLTKGSEWHYRDQAGRENVTKCSGSEVLKKMNVVALQSVDGPTLYFHKKDGDVYLVGVLSPARSPEIEFWNPPSLYLKAAPKTGDHWRYEGKQEEGQKTRDHIVDIEILATETVKMPAGTFPDCIRLRVKAFTTVDGKLQLIYDTEEWFAPGVGMVKYRWTKAPWEEHATDSFGAELVSYDVK